MAEETPVSPISAAEPPKVNPLAKATTTATLKPGLKLPPKPGMATATLKPGLKLPPKSGMATATLKPGLRLPTKPVIRKPGATVAAKPLPKPVTPMAAPVAASAPAAGVAPTPVPVDAQGIGKLPTVEAKAIARNDVKPVGSEIPKPMDALKSVTQKLKGVTQQIPQQAILRKTGIIAESAMTDAQKQAAKSKTARISLADAMGVAPVKNENAPLKTIRIKRPVDISGATNTNLTPVPPPAASAGGEAEKTPVIDSDVTVTQRKTLKIARPGGGAVRPTGKFGIKRPVSQTAAPAKPVVGGETLTSDGAAPDGAIADIPDIANIPDMPTDASAQSDGPAWLWTLSTLVQAAACVVIGALVWLLYQNSITQYF